MTISRFIFIDKNDMLLKTYKNKNKDINNGEKRSKNRLMGL